MAEKIRVREMALSEMEANYKYFRAFTYAKLRKEFQRTGSELPDKDLDIIAKEEGGLPLEHFIGDLESP